MRCILITVLVFCSMAALGAVPQLINYQGYLTNAGGAPLDTVVDITFSIYPTATTSSFSWRETQFACTVRAGRVNVLLGSFTSLPDIFFDPDRWLGIKVGNNSEMTPRMRMGSVPYAYRVGTVDSASGGGIIGKLNAGTGNSNAGQYAFAFGASNAAYGDYSTISGGRQNQTQDAYTTVGGGYYNRADSIGAVVGGGSNNWALGDYSAVGGGRWNEAVGYGAVAGGDSNLAYVFGAAGGGRWNKAEGWCSTVPGGEWNRALGQYSFAAGRRAVALHTGDFRWADANNADFIGPDTVSNSFAVRSSGGVWFFTNAAATSGAMLYPGSSAWNTISDSTKKRRYGQVDTQEILDQVAALPIERWSYKTQDESVQHIGPMAQDFWAAFHVGDDSLAISTIDPAGVALAAIQELIKRNEKLEIRNEQLEERIAKLEKQLSAKAGNEIQTTAHTINNE